MSGLGIPPGSVATPITQAAAVMPTAPAKPAAAAAPPSPAAAAAPALDSLDAHVARLDAAAAAPPLPAAAAAPALDLLDSHVARLDAAAAAPPPPAAVAASALDSLDAHVAQFAAAAAVPQAPAPVLDVPAAPGASDITFAPVARAVPASSPISAAAMMNARAVQVAAAKKTDPMPAPATPAAQAVSASGSSWSKWTKKVSKFGGVFRDAVVKETKILAGDAKDLVSEIGDGMVLTAQDTRALGERLQRNAAQRSSANPAAKSPCENEQPADGVAKSQCEGEQLANPAVQSQCESEQATGFWSSAGAVKDTLQQACRSGMAGSSVRPVSSLGQQDKTHTSTSILPSMRANYVDLELAMEPRALDVGFTFLQAREMLAKARSSKISKEFLHQAKELGHSAGVAAAEVREAASSVGVAAAEAANTVGTKATGAVAVASTTAALLTRRDAKEDPDGAAGDGDSVFEIGSDGKASEEDPWDDLNREVCKAPRQDEANDPFADLFGSGSPTSGSPIAAVGCDERSANFL